MTRLVSRIFIVVILATAFVDSVNAATLLEDSFSNGNTRDGWIQMTNGPTAYDYGTSGVATIVPGDANPSALWQNFNDTVLAPGQTLRLSFDVMMSSTNTQEWPVRFGLGYSSAPLSDGSNLTTRVDGYMSSVPFLGHNQDCVNYWIDGDPAGANWGNFNSTDIGNGTLDNNDNYSITNTIFRTVTYEIHRRSDGLLCAVTGVNGESCSRVTYTVTLANCKFNAVGLIASYNQGQTYTYDNVKVELITPTVVLEDSFSNGNTRDGWIQMTNGPTAYNYGTSGATLSADEPMTTVEPKDTGKALINPAMGWTMHFYSNVPRNYGSNLAPSDTLDTFPGVSTVYLRLPWVYLEPEEGKFNWAIFDTPAQRWISKGKKIALRLTTSENWMKFATPEWVKTAGAKGTFYQFNKGRVAESETWDPFFDDPVYLEKLDAFLAAAAKRYDGNPNVEFIDVGTYGMWGEGHTFMSSRQDSLEIQKLHIDLHLKHFKKTLLCISDDFAGHVKPGRNFPITDYALSKGVTLRDDSILVGKPPNSWHHAEMAQAFWPRFPVILEHEHYGGSVGRKAWSGALLLKSVEDYHASFMSIHWFPDIFLKENSAVIDAINLRMGYRLMPVSVTWPKTVSIATAQEAYTTYGDVSGHSDKSKSFKVQWSWVNKGVAPCYPGAYPALTIKDAKGGIVSVMVDEKLNLRDLKVGEPDKAPVTKHESVFIVGLFAPTTRPGSYDLYISAGSGDGTPTIELPLEGGDGQRRYRIGSIVLQAGN